MSQASEDVAQWLPMVRGMAVEMKKPGPIEVDDLVQVGCLGLLAAFRNFDPGRGNFKSYAKRCVWGSMTEWIRCQQLLPKGAHAKGTVVPTVGPIIGADHLVDRSMDVSHQAEVREEVDIVLSRLAGPERDLVESRYIREEYVESIARRHGITSRNVRIRLARILVQLKESRVRKVSSFRSYQKRIQPTLAVA